MKKNNLNVHKLHLLPKDVYDKFTKSVLIPSRADVMELEKDILKIYSNENMTKLERLLSYNNLLKEKLIKQLNSVNINNNTNTTPQTLPNNQRPVKNEESLQQASTQTIPLSPNHSIELPTQNNQPLHHSSPSRESDVFLPASSHFFPDDLYNNVPMDITTKNESFLNNIDMSQIQRDFLEDVRRVSGITNINDLRVKGFEDPDKSFVLVGKNDSFTDYMVDKPKIPGISRKRQRIVNYNPDGNESSPEKTPKRRKTWDVTPKKISPSKTRSGRVYPKDYKSQWQTFERLIREKASKQS
jgi:hypothetical protein